jgi:hypothetical protein
MKPLLTKISRALLVTPLLVAVFGLAVPASALAQAPSCDPYDVSQGVQGGANCAAPNTPGASQDLFGPNGIFVTITNILIFIVGAIAVLMLIIGGIRYVLSQGDQSAVTSAKNTILYAIIGIVVAMLAYGAVNFITQQLSQN